MTLHPTLINTLGGMSIEIVAAGTVIGKDVSGADITVQDDCAATNRNTIYMTQKTFDEMRRRSREESGQ